MASKRILKLIESKRRLKIKEILSEHKRRIDLKRHVGREKIDWNKFIVIYKKNKYFANSFLSSSTVFIFLLFLIVFRNEDVEGGYDENIFTEIVDNLGEESASENENENLGDFWIEIDKGDLHILSPVVEGVTAEKLDQGVGHHVDTSLPNRENGNVVLSGHRWLGGDIPARTVFIDLDRLEVKDKIKLHYEGEDFIYKIIEKKEVEDTEISILDHTDEPRITIYTCTPKYTSLRRLVYVGELVN